MKYDDIRAEVIELLREVRNAEWSGDKEADRMMLEVADKLVEMIRLDTDD